MSEILAGARISDIFYILCNLLSVSLTVTLILPPTGGGRWGLYVGEAGGGLNFLTTFVEELADFLLTTACNSYAAGTSELQYAVFVGVAYAVEHVKYLVGSALCHNDAESLVYLSDACIGMTDDA